MFVIGRIWKNRLQPLLVTDSGWIDHIILFRMPTDTDLLLLEVWREACRHIELEQSIERIALLVADQVRAEYLVVRQLDVARGGVETVAIGACRPDAAAVAPQRTDCSGAAMRQLLAWCR